MNWREMLPKGHPLHREPEVQTPALRFAFCETITASSISPWHIRRLTSRGKKLGGGADTPALCGRKVAWDLELEVSMHHLTQCCPKCSQLYREEHA
jgi:hypothetical protein